MPPENPPAERTYEAKQSPSSRIRIATRRTPLALAQAESVAARLRSKGFEVETVPMRTLGDRSLGGNVTVRRGLFTGELDQALLDGRADLAVHSLKDLPVDLEPGLAIAAIPERASPCDLLLRRAADAPSGWPSLGELLERGIGVMETIADAFAALPRGGIVGTSSPRRQAGALAARPDLVCCAVRGSVGRRLEWLASGVIDALLLAEAGLARLAGADTSPGATAAPNSGAPNLGAPALATPPLAVPPIAAVRLDPHEWPPAPGQGALAVVVAQDGPWRRHDAILGLDDPLVSAAVGWERALLRQLGGGCGQPVAALHEPDRCSATVAAADWRREAGRGAAPRIAYVNTRDSSRESFERMVHTLRAGVAVADPPASGTVAPPELVVTSSEETTARLTSGLASLLGRAVHAVAVPVTRAVALERGWPAGEAARCVATAGDRRRWPWVLVSSPSSGRILVERCRDEPVWASLPWCALGEGTARTLLALGNPPNLVAGARDGRGFAEFAADHLSQVSALFLPQSQIADGALVERLHARGFEVFAFAAYRTEALELEGWPAQWRGLPERILFTSPSAVRSVRSAALPLAATCWAIGESTARALRAAGIPLAGVAATPTAEGVAALWRRS